MIIREWNNLPDSMRCDAVKPYYLQLRRRKVSLIAKRLFDIVVSLILLIVLSPLFLVLSIMIKVDSSGPVFFRQERVTQYGKHFRIFKFRTMIVDAEQTGSQVTVHNDSRITRIGKKIRKYRLDELSQLIDILRGTMTFVGTRPEVMKYVDRYTSEMKATLLLPAGVTSEASIRFKDEEHLLVGESDVDSAYVEKVLPRKMAYNLWAIAHFSLWRDVKTLVWTVLAVIKRERVAPSFDVGEGLKNR